MYCIGDYVVKANNGICRIEDIVSLDDSAAERKYYLMIPQQEKSAKLYVPVDTKNLKLRYAMSEKDAWNIIDRIPDIDEAWINDEKQRESKYKEAIRSCNPEMLIGIIKNMYVRRKKRTEQGKKSTAIDERYFKLAEDALYSEIAFAIGRDKEEISGIIEKRIGKEQPPKE